MRNRKSAIALTVGLLLLAWRAGGLCQTSQSEHYSGLYGDLRDVYLDDNSDWWSEIPRTLGGEPAGRILDAPPNRGSFQILGLSVWGYSVRWPQKIVRTLGLATVIERGDAALGRAQVCYESPGDGGTKLIFESGECAESFYLFEGGSSFRGSDSCVSSTRVTPQLKTPTGLGLGLTRAEVIRILGRPSAADSDYLVYKYHLKMERTREQMQAQKREDPDLAPELGYDDVLSVLIRFRNGRSWYLYVTSEIC